MLKKYTQAWGISGQEWNISDMIVEDVKDYADEIIRDAMGNLIVLKKGYGEAKKKIMCAAHMDEIGLSVVRITEKGFLRVKPIGGVSAISSFWNRVQFQNGTMGTVGAFKEQDDLKRGDVNELYVDIGAMSKEEAEKYVQVGDCAVFCGDYVELAGRNVMAKAFDDRVACYIQVQVLQNMKQPYHDVYFVFTVQEEIGLVGAKTASETVKPDLGIAIDVTGSFDLPNNEHGNAVLGKGAAIKINDSSVLCDEKMTKELIDFAMEKEIPYQRDVLAGGGTDAGAMNQSGGGVKALGISVPTRNPHSPNSIINLDDVDACIRLLQEYVTSKVHIVTMEKIK